MNAISKATTSSSSWTGIAAVASTVLDRTVFIGLQAVMIVALFFYGTVDAWWESTFECAVFVLTAIWILGTLFKPRLKLDRLSPVWPLVALTAYAYFQTLVLPAPLTKMLGLVQQRTLSIDLYQTQLTARKILALTLFFGLLYLHTSSSGRIRWLIRTVIAAGVGTALFGMIRQLLQSQDSTQGFVLTFLFYGVGYGQFISPNVFAYVMEMSFALVAGLLLGGGLRRNVILLYVTMLALIWTALVLANSRGAILSFACETVFLLFISGRWFLSRREASNNGLNRWLQFVNDSRLVRVGIYAIIIVVLAVGVIWMGGQDLAGKFARESSGSSQVRMDGLTRREIWSASWKLIKQHPWTGTGFGCYFLGITAHEASSGSIKLEQAHNDYLDLAANGGVIAVALAGWFLFTILRRARRFLQSRDSYRRAACLGALAAVVGISVHSLVDFGLQLTGIATMFAAVLVILVADTSAASKKNVAR